MKIYLLMKHWKNDPYEPPEVFECFLHERAALAALKYHRRSKDFSFYLEYQEVNIHEIYSSTRTL